jgi:integrase
VEVGLAQTPPKLKLAAALFFYTAQRPSDIMVMDWSQVFIRNGKIWIKLKSEFDT